MDNSKLNIKKYIHESNLIEGYDDLQADQQSIVAWDWLMRRHRKTLDKSIICTLQKRITLFQTDLLPNQRGYYRGEAGNHVEVQIGGRIAQHSIMVPHFMDNWLLDYKDRDPKINHIAFERIHPFVDGNGRTGRMLMWWQELKNGEVPTLIKFKDRQKYYRWFNARLV